MTFDEAMSTARADLERIHAARESTLQLSRQLIQLSSKAIRHVHRNQLTEAGELIASGKAISRKLREELTNTPEVLYAGYLQDAEKELVEAAIVYSMVQKEPFPDAAELGVQVSSYLNGLGEAASEARRYMLDVMRSGNNDEATRILKQMELIYDELISFDFPDGMTGGLRRTCDALRAVIERSRSDLTMTVIQSKLIDELRSKG